MLNGWAHDWMLRLAFASRWLRLAVMLLVVALVQLVFWSVWSLSVDPTQLRHEQATQPHGSDDEFELATWMTPEQMAAWHMPKEWFDSHGQAKLDSMQGYWQALQESAVLQGLDVEYAVADTRVDWFLTGEFDGLMSWLHDLSQNHPRLVFHKLNLSPLGVGQRMTVHVQMSVQGDVLGLFEDGLAPASKASEPFELAAMPSWLNTLEAEKLALHEVNYAGGLSPFGLGPWLDQLDEAWWSKGMGSERQTPLQLLPLSQIEWVGSLIEGQRAVALLSAQGVIWTVSPGDRVGQGLSRLLDVQPDGVLFEVITPNEAGFLQTTQMTLGVSKP